MNVDNKKSPNIQIEKGTKPNVKAVMTPEIEATMNHAIQNEEKVIKIQAGVRGFLARKEAKTSNSKPAKKSSRGGRQSQRNQIVEEPAVPLLSHRSGEVLASGRKQGGDSSQRKEPGSKRNESGRNELQNAKPLDAMPDYSNEATREAESQLGSFVFDFDHDSLACEGLIERGPYELSNGATYKG